MNEKLKLQSFKKNIERCFFFFFLLFLNSKSKLNEIKHCLLLVLERCVFMN